MTAIRESREVTEEYVLERVRMFLWKIANTTGSFIKRVRKRFKIAAKINTDDRHESNCLKITRETLLIEALRVPSIWSINWKKLMCFIEQEFGINTRARLHRGLMPKFAGDWLRIDRNLVDYQLNFTSGENGGVEKVRCELSLFTDISSFLAKPTFETFLGLYTVGMVVDFVVWSLRTMAE